MEEEGHDTGVGTPHRFVAPPPVSAEQVAAELSARMGVPCAVVPVWDGRSVVDSLVEGPAVVDDGDVTCAQADSGPEGALAQLLAMVEMVQSDLSRQAWERERNRRARVRDEAIAYLKRSEDDWAALAKCAEGETATWVVEAKQLHDAQVAELFERIGAVL